MRICTKNVIWLVFCLCSTAAMAQSGLEDSLQNILSKSKNDKQYIDKSHDLVDQFMFSNPDMARRLLIKTITKGQQINYQKGVADAYAKLGVYYAITNNMPLAENYFEQAISILSSLPDEQEALAKTYNNLGLMHRKLGNYPMALENFEKAEEIAITLEDRTILYSIYNNEGLVYKNIGDLESAVQAFIKSLNLKEETNDLAGVALTRSNIANLYLQQGQFELSRETTFESLDIFRSLNSDEYAGRLGGAHFNIATSYLSENKLDSAIIYYDSATLYYNKMEDIHALAATQLNLARVYHEKKKYAESLVYAEEALDYFTNSSAKSLLASTYIIMADNHIKLGKRELMLENLLKGISLANAINDTKNLMDIYNLLFEYYLSIGDYEKAPENHVAYAEKRVEFFNLEKNKIDQIMNKYQLDKKEKENEVLRQMYFRKEAENKALIGAVLFFFMFTTYFYHVNEAKRRHNLLLIAQNSDIYGKQENILAINRSLIQSQKITEALNDELKIINADLEEKVADRTRRLAQANQELDTFLYQSSHALRRPIVNILGLVKIARLEPDPERVPEVYGKMDETAYKMDGMLKKLVMVSEINSLKLQLEQMDFNALTEDIRSQLMPAIELKNINFKICIKDQIKFISDKRLMNLILYNIMENAVNFSFPMPDRPSYVQMEISQQEDRNICIYIKDNGIGILEEALSTVFHMFAVADNKSRGYGLGLYIVKKAVDKLSGKHFISSKKFEYTAVKIELPCAQALKKKNKSLHNIS